MPDTCHFCKGPDACYMKKDRAGVWRDACWKCVVTKKTAPTPEPATDLTILDDEAPVSPVSLTSSTTPKTPGMLF